MPPSATAAPSTRFLIPATARQREQPPRSPNSWRSAYLDVERHADAPDTISLRSSARLTRSGMAVKLVQADGCTAGATPQASLIKQLATARRWWLELRKGELDVTRLAEREKVTASYVTRFLRLAFLSPSLTQAILAGKHPAYVDVGALIRTGAVAPSWSAQARKTA